MRKRRHFGGHFRPSPPQESPRSRTRLGLGGVPSQGFLWRFARGQGRLLVQLSSPSSSKYSIRPFCWTATTGALKCTNWALLIAALTTDRGNLGFPCSSGQTSHAASSRVITGTSEFRSAFNMDSSRGPGIFEYRRQSVVQSAEGSLRINAPIMRIHPPTIISGFGAIRGKRGAGREKKATPSVRLDRPCPLPRQG